MPYFSVIIPVYNGAHFVRDCLESIDRARQKLPDSVDVEVICVDDGSVDDSLRKLRQYESENAWVRVFSQENMGVSIARNAGLEQTRGEWISFVDCDDLVEENYFTFFYEKSEKSDINFFAHTRFYAGGECQRNWLTEDVVLQDQDEIAKFIFRLIYNKTTENLFGYTWNAYIRRALLDEYGVKFPRIKWFMEYEDEIFKLWVIHYAQTFSYSSTPIYRYRVGDNNHFTRTEPQHLTRAHLELEVGDADDRFELKSAAYMGCGIALVMQCYRTCSMQVAYQTMRFLQTHREYMREVPNQRNPLVKLSRMNSCVLFALLYLHGLYGTVRKGVRSISRR